MKSSALWLVLSQLTAIGTADAHSHHHAHSHLHHLRRHENGTDSSLSAAEKLLESGQRAMAHANQHIVANPRPNRLEVLNSTGLAEAKKPPPPLDYLNNSTSSIHRRAHNSNNNNNTAESDYDARYTVPEELIAAARLLSESWQPPREDTGYDEYDGAVARLKREYKYQVNDTNMMPPVLEHGSGLTSRIEEPPSAFRYSDNETDTVETKYVTPNEDGKIEKRAAADDWWMAKMRQTGSSPFAPSGYQVWRNVKDFGAKGEFGVQSTFLLFIKYVLT